MTTQLEDAISGCDANKETSAVVGKKEITFEVVVMEELTTLKHLVLELTKKQETHDKGMSDELIGLKTSYSSIQASIETLEGVVKSKGNGSSSNLEKDPFEDPSFFTEQQRYLDDLEKVCSKRKIVTDDELFRIGKEPLDEGCVKATSKRQVFNGGNSSVMGALDQMVDDDIDRSVCKNVMSTLEKRPLFPGIWTKPEGGSNHKKSASQSMLITKTDSKRHPHFTQRTPSRTGGGGMPKKLEFHTPTPHPTEIRGSKSCGKGTKKKELVKSEEGIKKKARKSREVTPKMQETDTPQELTYRMAVAAKEAQVCTFLFKTQSDATFMNDILVYSLGMEATRSELHCLIPERPISDKVIALAAARITDIHTERKAVWCLPPSFAADMLSRLSTKEISEKYCGCWMPPYKNLKFIYIPIKTPMETLQDHWYLMIVDIETGITYRLDTHCPRGCIELRDYTITKLGMLLYHLLDNARYSLAFHNKRIDFDRYTVVEGRGLPNVGDSMNSGVWVLDWLNMEHFFNPDTIRGTLQEKEVRMKTAANLLMGEHNGLRFEVTTKTETWIKSLPDSRHIDLSDD